MRIWSHIEAVMAPLVLAHCGLVGEAPHPPPGVSAKVLTPTIAGALLVGVLIAYFARLRANRKLFSKARQKDPCLTWEGFNRNQGLTPSQRWDEFEAQRSELIHKSREVNSHDKVKSH